jgi:lipopolysaccharide/colanic/teichoic acid biosynthesis glycosyltransferase
MSIEIESNPEVHIPKMISQGVNQLPVSVKAEMEDVFGAKRLDPGSINEDNFKRARKYLESPQKVWTEQLLAGLAFYPWGHLMQSAMSNYVAKVDGPKGTYALKVGFPETTIYENKIRTMYNGADERENGPFEGAAYSGVGYANGKVIDNPRIKMYRRMGLDEIPQIRAVALARMSLVGIRAYTIGELQDQERIFVLKDNPDLGNSDEVKWIVANHHEYIRRQYLRPGVFHPNACLRAGTIMSRLRLDLMYMFLASPRLDMEIFFKAFINKERAAFKNGLRNKS